MASAQRPDDCYLHHDAPLFTAWPTKLAFAPRLAGKLLSALNEQGISATASYDLSALQCLPRPVLSNSPWDTATWS